MYWSSCSILFCSEPKLQKMNWNFLRLLSIAFNVPQTEFRNIKSFILGSINDIPEKKRVMIIDNKPDSDYKGMKHLYQGKSE